MKIEFYIGIDNIAERNKDVENALKLVSQAYGGATLYYHTGGWYNNDHKYVLDQGITIVAIQFDGPAKSREIAIKLRDMFDQECVLYCAYETRQREII